MSGGRGLEACAGDVSAIHEDGAALMRAFVIECKHVRGDLFGPLVFLQRNTPVIKWWEKLKAEGSRYSRLPMLIVQQTGKQRILVGLDNTGIKMTGRLGVSFPQIGLHVLPIEEVLTEHFLVWVNSRKRRIRI